MPGKTQKGRALGRGLDALFADQSPVLEGSSKNDGDAVVYIDIRDIRPNPAQPRKYFDPNGIEELAESIRSHGIIQPLVVRQSGKVYEIVAGERRWRAARAADLAKVPCLIREFTDEENMLVAIIENMQREDLNPIEEAEGLEQMIKTFGLTQEEVSRSVGKSRPYITNSLRLLRLPDSVRAYIIEGKISAGHAKVLLNAGEEDLLLAYCEKISNDNLSVRELERMIQAAPKKKKKPVRKRKSADTIRVEEELKSKFGTKVTINQKGKKGTIELEYYGQEDLNRIVDLLSSL